MMVFKELLRRILLRMKGIFAKAGKPSVHKLLSPYSSALAQPAQVQSFQTL